MRKTHYEKTGVSRTMEWLKITPKIQRDFKENFLNIGIDYLQYTCYKISEPLKNLYYMLGFNGEIDTDNSNVCYNFNLNLAMENRQTKMGNAYAISFLSPGFAPIPIISVEVYNPNRVQTLGTQGKIVFYGAYFVFSDIISEEAPEVIRFANTVEIGTLVQTHKNEKPVYKRTRVDVALDVKVPFSQKWLTKYIRPHKTRKSVPRPYNYQPDLGGWQSISYIPRITKCNGIRVYNKILDIQAKNKKSWYPDYGTEENPIVTRVEIIYAGDSAMDNLDNLIAYTKFRLLGDEETKIKRISRPKSEYSPLSAFNYFKKYAKNHGKKLHEILYDITQMMIQEEEKNKDFSLAI